MLPYTITIVVICSAILLPVLYLYFTRNYNYWKRRGVQGPNPWPVFGNYLMAYFQPLPHLEIDLSKKYGTVYGLFCGNTPTLTVNDPKLIRLILVKDFNAFSNRRTYKTSHEILDKTILYSKDEDWKRLRSLSTSVFTSKKLKHMFPVILGCVDELEQCLQELPDSGLELNLKQFCTNYSMDVIASCAFATKINAYKDKNHAFVRNAQNIFRPNVVKMLATFFFNKFFLRLLKIKSMFDEKSNQYIFDLSRKLMDDRRKSNQVYNDFLQLLLDARKDEDIPEDQKLKNKIKNKIKLTDEEIIAQSWLFLLAGYETTSSGLTYCFYELALNPDIQEKLYEELQTAINSFGRFDYEILWKLPFLDAIISETLRLYPPFLRIEREVNTEYKLGDTGIVLEPGIYVQISLYAVHRNEELFAEPNKFDPNRFMPENKDKLVAYSYLPFAIGPRNCIATRLALMEMKVCIAHVINKFQLSPNSRTDIPPKFLTETHLCSSEPLIVDIKNR